MIMKGRFILDYLDENNFKKLERSLKKYNMKNTPASINCEAGGVVFYRKD